VGLTKGGLITVAQAKQALPRWVKPAWALQVDKSKACLTRVIPSKPALPQWVQPKLALPHWAHLNLPQWVLPKRALPVGPTKVRLTTVLSNKAGAIAVGPTKVGLITIGTTTVRTIGLTI
jgi:hypothetical protein